MRAPSLQHCDLTPYHGDHLAPDPPAWSPAPSGGHWLLLLTAAPSNPPPAPSPSKYPLSTTAGHMVWTCFLHCTCPFSSETRQVCSSSLCQEVWKAGWGAGEGSACFLGGHMSAPQRPWQVGWWTPEQRGDSRTERGHINPQQLFDLSGPLPACPESRRSTRGYLTTAPGCPWAQEGWLPEHTMRGTVSKTELRRQGKGTPLASMAVSRKLESSYHAMTRARQTGHQALAASTVLPPVGHSLQPPGEKSSAW